MGECIQGGNWECGGTRSLSEVPSRQEEIGKARGKRTRGGGRYSQGFARRFAGSDKNSAWAGKTGTDAWYQSLNNFKFFNLNFQFKARELAEEKTATLLRQKAIEDKKMRELEKIREQLETCLDEERQAKKDEEIVRQLQARVLEEEWGRREALEKLQEEQRMMLEEERRKREAFEQEQSEKESQLRGNNFCDLARICVDPDLRDM